VSDLCNACIDWLTVTNIGLQFGKMLVTDIERLCKQAVHALLKIITQL